MLPPANMLSEPENLPTEAVSPPPEGALPPTPAPPLRPREIWSARDLLLFVASLPFALILSKIVVLIGYVVLRPFAGWRAPAEAAQSETIFLLVEQGVFYVLIVGFLFLLARLRHHQPFWKSMGWKMPTVTQALIYLAGGGGLALAVSLALSVRPDSQPFPLERLFNSRTASYAIGIFAIGVAPAVEELVFRGLLFAILERAMGLRFAVVATAALFAGLHVPEYWHAWHHIFMILVVGLVFSFARGSTGSLTPSIILHIGYNALIITGLFVSTQHFRTGAGWWIRGW